MLSILRQLTVYFLVVSLFFSGLALAQRSTDEEEEKPKQETPAELCFNVAKTPMEKAYCKIMQADDSIRLPPMSDFRRNPPSTQALLLKRAAKRAGVTLPNVSGDKSRLEAAKRQAIRKVDPLAAPKKDVPGPASSVFSTELNGCTLQDKAIQCGNQRYALQYNLPNSKLPKNALSKENKLGLPSEPEFVSEIEKRRYLWRCYQLYIDKMTQIGLSASTVPFTKFYYMYEEGKAKKVDFAVRFEKTFDFLKRDKLNLAVRSTYSKETPSSLKACSSLTKDYIVCDKGSINWVFKRI